MAHFPAMDPGPPGPDDLEYPTGDAALFILLAPGRPGAPAAGRRGALAPLGRLRHRRATRQRSATTGAGQEKCDSPSPAPADSSLRLGLAALGLAAAGGYLVRILMARSELREH
jgi:hypothetical protein